MATEGKTISWNKTTNTGWKYTGGKWVQYRGGKPTGRTSKTRLGTTALSTLNPNQYNQPTANLNQSNKTTKNNNNKKGSSSSKTAYDLPNTGITFKQAIAKGTGIKVVGSKLYNLKNREELTAYNKAKKASLSGNKGESSNRDKISSNNKGGKKGNNFTTNVHTRHYKTGERLGVMTRNQRRAYEKEAGGKTFEGEVAKHEKSSGHGKSHLRETKYKASLRKNRNKLKGEKTTNSPLHKPGGPNSQFNKDGSPKTKKSTPNPVQQNINNAANLIKRKKAKNIVEAMFTR